MKTKTTYLLLILFFPMFCLSQKQEKAPNFILILSDDQGWTSSSQLMNDNIPNSKSDYFETPAIEKLAERGMRFSNGYAPCALCCPTRRSIQFAQTPMRQGDDEQFIKNYTNNPNRANSIPEILKWVNPQYRAAHYGKWDLRADIFPEDLGYDESDGNTGNRNGDVNSTKETKFTARFRELMIQSELRPLLPGHSILCNAMLKPEIPFICRFRITQPMLTCKPPKNSTTNI
jgi:arylsulfatase A-like enzyme